ncbi:MAG: ychF [Chlamydiales bacterium]|jgi:GTP-binding protein YchF|nr:ychF [Chlamydiales bacterium]
MADGLSCGIVGLPNVGKSTLFNALTRNQAPAANYPFCTIDPNVGIVEVLDPRLEVLSKISNSKKTVPAIMKFVDIAGLVAGASQGEGLGNKFLANIRETDAIAHVVRCFDDDDVIHVSGKVDPLRDIEVINLELILADLQMCENVISRLQKQIKGKKELQVELDAILKVQQRLNDGLPARSLELTAEEKQILRQYPFLTAKPVLYVTNVSEKDLPLMRNGYVEQVEAYAQKEGSRVIPICAQLEGEIGQMSPEEAKEMLQVMGLEDSGLNRLIKAGFDLLGLITYLTTGEMETRAWTIKQGTSAHLAAGEIHSDIQKGFIRAEVIKYDDVVAYNGRGGAKEVGKVRFEGKEYIVQDGDVILFMHN